MSGKWTLRQARPPSITGSINVKTAQIDTAKIENLEGAALSGLNSWKGSVRAGSTSNVTTLSGSVVVDGVTLVTGNTVLLKNQTDGSQNGIWYVNDTTWTRDESMIEGSNAAGAAVFVNEGTTNGDTIWVCTDDEGNAVVGTDALTFATITSVIGAAGSDTQVQFNSSGALAGDTGLTYVSGSGTLTATVLTDGTATLSSGNLTGGVAATFSGAVTGGSLTDGTATLSSGNLTGAVAVTASGAVTGGSLTDGTATLSSGNLTGGVAATFSGAVTGGSLTDGTATLSSGALSSATTVTASGAVTGGSLTDGTATLSSGALSSATTVTASGAITGGSLTDGTATLSSGALSSATTVTASGAVTGGSLTDGTATLSSGALSGATTGSFSGNVDATGGLDVNADNVALSVGAGGDFSITHDATNTTVTSTTGDLIVDNTLATGSTIMRLGTDTVATDYQIQNNSEVALLTVYGTGNMVTKDSLNVKGRISKTTTVTTVATAGAVTYTAAQVWGGFISRDPAGASRSDTTDTAANLVAVVQDAEVGSSFEFFIDNTADAEEVITLSPGPGVTLSGTMTIGRDDGRNFLAVFTNVAGGSEAVTVYDKGSVSATGEPGGANTQLQFNDNGDLNGISSWTTNGSTQFNGADNAVLNIGTSNDFSITHDATNTTMTSATGDLIIDNTLATGSTINRLGTDTTATDFQVQNNSEAALFTVDGSGAVTAVGNIALAADSKTLTIGAGGASDLGFTHDGTNSLISSGTGDLIIDNTLATGSTINRLGTDTSATDFQVQNNSASALFTVDASGQADFSGNVDATGGVDIDADNVALTVGAGTDFSISHDATNTTMTSATGDLIIDNTLATGSTINRLGTDTSATDFQVQNNSGAALVTVYGSGDTVMADDLIVQGNFSKTTTVTTITTAGVATYTAAQMWGGFISRDPAGADRSDVTDTAANLVAAIQDAEIGSSFEFFVDNTADAAEAITVTAGTGVTLSGAMIIPQNDGRRFLVVCNNVAGGTEAVTIYDQGDLIPDGIGTSSDTELLYNNSGTVDGTSSWTSNGSTTLNGADNAVLNIGTGNDFSITHNATNTIVTSTTGDLIIDNTLATGSTINRLGTDTSATDFQVQNNSEAALFTVDGSGAVTTTGVVTTPGITTSGKTTVTQLTNINTAVTSNTLSGVITTVTATNSGQASEIFTVNCSVCTSTSIILTNVLGYSGTYDTNGHPDTVVDDVANGSFNIVVVNNDNSALDGVLNIGYMIV